MFKVIPTIGTTLKMDNTQKYHTIIELEDWDKADYGIDTGYEAGITSVAINVIQTGRTMQLVDSRLAVRVKVVFVGDCEDDYTEGAWMFVHPSSIN